MIATSCNIRVGAFEHPLTAATRLYLAKYSGTP